MGQSGIYEDLNKYNLSIIKQMEVYKSSKH